MNNEHSDDDDPVHERSHFLRNDDDDEVSNLRDEYGLDDDEAREVKDLMDTEGLDAEEAVEVREAIGGSEGGGGVIGSLIIIGLLVWGGFTVWNWIFPDSNPEYENSYGDYYQNPFDSGRDCLEPENPYGEGSGHYAGWQWGEEGNYCSGNSNSFVEGCEEYEDAESVYEECLER